MQVRKLPGRTILCLALLAVAAVMAGLFIARRSHRAIAPATEPVNAAPSGARRDGAGSRGLGVVPASEDGLAPAAVTQAASPSRLVRFTGRAVKPGPAGDSALWVPAAGVQVRLESAGIAAVTGEDGRFVLASARGGGEIDVRLDLPGHALRVLAIALGPEEDEENQDLGDVALPSGIHAEVRVANEREEPIPGAIVTIERLWATQSEPALEWCLDDKPMPLTERGEGFYALERATPGGQEVRVTARGFAPAQEIFDLPAEEPIVIILREGRKVEGAVRDAGGKAVEDVRVRVLKDGASEGALAEVMSDAVGRFLFEHLPPDEYYDLRAEAEGFALATKRVRRDVQGAQLWLFRQGVVAGEVLASEDASPIAGAHVSLKASGHAAWDGATETDEGGGFVIRKLIPGIYDLRVNHEQFLPILRARIEVAEGERTLAGAIHLERGIVVEGKVVDAATGKPVPGATIIAQGSDSPSVWRKATSDSGGTFVLAGLRREDYQLTLEAEGYLARDESFSAPLELGTPWTLALEQEGVIIGKVKDPNGRPVEGAGIFLDARSTDCPHGVRQFMAAMIASNYTRKPLTETDGEGRFEVHGLPPSPVTPSSAGSKASCRVFFGT